MEAIQKIKKALCKRFEMKDLSEAKIILGLEISRDKTLGTLKLSQGKNATQVLEKCGMAECNPIATPLEVGLQLAKLEKSNESLPYREAVGSLMYLMVRTRPDFAFAVGKLSRFLSCYGKEHWAAVKSVLRYVQGSVDKGLVYNQSSWGILQGYSDIVWAGDYETRRSTTGFMFIFGGVAFSWASKLQKTVALCTMEAEYMDLCEASKEAVRLDKLFQRVTMLVTQSDNLVGPVNIKVDNSGCIKFAKSPVEHKRTKHIDIRYHFVRDDFVRDASATDKVILEHCPTDEMAENPMKKEPAKVKHDQHVKVMGMC